MKNILIIGASSGIGSALAQTLSPNHQVMGTYHRNAPVSIPSNVAFHPLDVMSETPDLSFIPETLDGLVYCPGAINLKPFHRITEADMIQDYKLQVTGAVKVIQACLPALKKSEQGSIVLFSTIAVRMGFGFHGIVSSSKGAVEGLTKTLAAELAPKIRVNCIAPSLTQTPLAGSMLNTPEKIETHAQRHPLKRIGAAEDLANAAAYLLGSDSGWMTGQILSIDGGMSSIR